MRLKFEWNDRSEDDFVEWFHSNMTDYTFRSEWFYGDCTVEDVKTRQDLMYKWIHAAFTEGHKLGRKGYND